MKVLVANLGSTSFKYRLFDLDDPAEPVLARGAIDRIGSPASRVFCKTDKGEVETSREVADHGDAVQICLDQLVDPTIGVLKDPSEVSAIGFKAVHARNLTGVQLVDEEVLLAMEALNDVVPAHNPPYVKAMRGLRERFPKLPLVAAYETGFHRTIPEASQRYAIPEEWSTALGIRRWGFHGASHRYVSWRLAELLGRQEYKAVSCHLGGSSSLTAIRDGASIATSMGMSPQSGLPQNNRVGDFDVFALPALMRDTGKSLEEVLETLAEQSGLQGICGKNDVRDVESAAAAGDPSAQLALNVFVASIRQYLGAYLLELGGADAIVFTGGIGENSSLIRSKTLADLDWFGIELDPALNAGGPAERRISAEKSRVQVWIVPANEELVVARQSQALLKSGRSGIA